MPETAICKDLIYKAVTEAHSLIDEALTRAMEKGALPAVELAPYCVELAADTVNGDFTCNAAAANSQMLQRSPWDISKAILKELDLSESFFERAELVEPGFVGLFLRRRWFSNVVDSILLLGDVYGHTNYGQGEKIMVEFASACPTGPMQIGDARNGVFGDCLAGVLNAAGYNVTREYFVSDIGAPVAELGLSLEAGYLERIKHGGRAESNDDWAVESAERFGDSLLELEPEARREALLAFILPRSIGSMEEELRRLRVVFEIWFRESTLYDSGIVNLVISRLGDKELTYEENGELWYRATEYGAEKDELLVRQNGEPTYFATDLAYHYNKFALRSFFRVINVWNAGYHGHSMRLKSALDAIGLNGNRLEVILVRPVRVINNEESAPDTALSRMLDEIPAESARFLFAMREPGSVMDFDMDLAAEGSGKNPVRHILSVCAEIQELLADLRREGVEQRDCTLDELSLLTETEEVELIRQLAMCPGVIIEAAVQRSPAKVAYYLSETAASAQKFYLALRIRSENESLTQARIALCLAANTTLSNLLTLLKVEASETR